MSDSSHPFNRPEFTLNKKRPKKALIIVGGLIALLVISGVVVYFYKDQLFGDRATDVSQIEEQPGTDEEQVLKTVADATTHIATGDTTAGVAVIDDAIEATSSTVQKSALYHNKATMLASSDLSAAIKASEQSVEIEPNFQNTAYLAELYERNGDTEKAIEFYGKTIVLYNQLKHSENGRSTDASLYQERIDRLRGQ